MTEQEFTDAVARIEQAQVQLAAVQDSIVKELAEQRKMMLTVLEAIGQSNKLMDSSDALAMELAKMRRH